MKFAIQTGDPFHVLSSTKPIVQNLHHIIIHENAFDQISKRIEQQLIKGLDIAQTHFGETKNLEDAIQLIFFEDTVNFCFWAEKNKPKWQVEWPKGTVATGGWYSLGKCFQRAIAENVPILDCDYLIGLNGKQAQSIFKGTNNIQIPLLKQRVTCLIESASNLKRKYHGQFINLLEQAHFDAIRIVELLLNDFPSFRDVSKLNGKEIYFLKRSQICAQDFSYLSQKYKKLKIANIELLTAFADYKLPQMLRHYNVISYKKELADKIDNYVLIPEGSREEIEIRSATIWCIELIRQKLKNYTSADIDNALWLISQNQAGIKPYHRTYTMYY